MKKKKFLYFLIFSNLIIFLTLELSSNLALRIFYTPNILDNEKGAYDLQLDINPFTEFDKDIGYHIRRDPFTKKTKAYLVTLESGNKVPGIISYDLKEGIVRSGRGDILINKWGFRGPYVEKEKPDHIYRIVTLGGSTTAGKYENEQTYPRMLERILNDQEKGLNYQVLNFGVWGYNSCDLKTVYKNEVLEFNPDMIIIMSGWNDIEKQGQKKIKSIDDYCKKNYSVLSNSSLYRLLEFWIKTPWQEKQSPSGSIENFKNNSIYYLENMRGIISDAQNRNILVGMVDLPALYTTKISNETLKKLPHFRHLTIDRMNYQLKSGLKMNKLIGQVASQFENAFHVNHSISFGTGLKAVFFFDEIHPTGAGNRLLAFNIMEKINQLNSKDKKPIKSNHSKSFDKNELETEYLKSIVSSFRIEDLSFTACIVFHGRCTFVPGIDRGEFVASVSEFSLGILLNFPEDLRRPEIYELIEKSLIKSTQLIPHFSPPYWILSQFYYNVGQIEAAKLWNQKANFINPLMNDPLFFESLRGHKTNIKNNKFFKSLPDFRKTFKNKLPYGAYEHFNQLKEPLISKRNPSENIQIYFDAYYLTPLMVRSIFENSIQYLISVKEFEIALELIQKLKSIKPEYDFRKIFSNYENEINKLKLASAN